MFVIRFHIPQIRFQRLDLAEISFQLDAQLPVLLLQVLDVELERFFLLLEARIKFPVRDFAQLQLLCIRSAVLTCW